MLTTGTNAGEQVPDRLGTIRGGYPYGEAVGTQPIGTAWATYERDGSSTSLDYAKNRYYSSTLARFMSPDPYRNSAGPGDPGSWNRYAYVGNDPVNFNDGGGLARCSVGTGEETTDCYVEYFPGRDNAESEQAYYSPPPDPISKIYPRMSGSDKKIADDAKKQAENVAKGKDCNGALSGFGIPSLKDLIQKLTINDNTFDGRTSDYYLPDRHETVSQYLNENTAGIGAITSIGGNAAANVTFLGAAFFNPGIANVPSTNYGLAQAFVLLHEAVHLVGGKFDADFGGSKALTKLLIDHCFPAMRGHLGGLE